MARSQSKKMTDVEKKNRQQQEELRSYKKREMWIKRAGLAVLALVVLLFLLMGVTNDWWKGAKNDSLHQFTPTSAEGSGLEGTTTPGTTTTTNTTQPGTTETGTNSSTTTNTSTTTTNNNPAESSPTPPTLVEVVQGVADGQTLDDVLARAQAGGAHASCHNELLVFRVCTITSGDDSVTVKALNSGEVVDVDSTF